MIRTRVLVGSGLALAVFAVLIGDQWLGPWFPCLFIWLAVAGALAARELCALYPPAFRPPTGPVVAAALAVVAANWYPVLQRELGPPLPAAASPWVPVLFAFVAVLLVFFLAEMARFREPGAAIPRLALAVFAVAYLGILSSFLAQLRWVAADPARSSLILAVTIFATKACDIGAFFTGTFAGRTKMTPVLSPKKTWEGLAGGLVAAAGIGAVAAYLGGESNPLFRGGVAEAIAFGVVVGAAGVLGDLAESLIKRDGQTKDASHRIPGFGGVLDVIDSVLFAAPVAYLWFQWPRAM